MLNRFCPSIPRFAALRQFPISAAPHRHPLQRRLQLHIDVPLSRDAWRVRGPLNGDLGLGTRTDHHFGSHHPNHGEVSEIRVELGQGDLPNMVSGLLPAPIAAG